MGERDIGHVAREDTQMRLSIIGSVIIVLASTGLAPSFAAAQNATMRGHYHYSSCNCHFGYNYNEKGACEPEVSCYSEGGRCSQSCIAPSSPE
jgi:hypothetical protein